MPPTPPKRILGLPRNIFTLGLTSFFNDFSNEMILAAFPAFFTSVLKAGAASLGLVEGVADGASNFLKIYSGRLSDRMQKRRIFIFLGYGMSVAIRPFYLLAHAVAPVLGLRILDRIGKGLREPPRDVIISASTPAGEIGRSFGYHRAMDSAGGILGPLAAYLILSHWPSSASAEGFNVIFVLATVLGIVAVSTIFFVRDVVGARDANGDKVVSLAKVSALPRAFHWYIAAIFLLSVGSLPVAVMLLKTTSIGLVIADIPLYYMIYGIAYTAYSYSAGKLSDSIGTTKVMVAGYVLLLISYFVTGISGGQYALAVAFVVLGVFSAATDATQRAYTGRIVDFEHRGTAYGLFNAAIGFGAMVSGITGGYLWQAFGPGTALTAAAIMVLVGLMALRVSVKVKNTR